MAIICRKQKILYVQVPGTGCTIAGDIFIRRFGGDVLGRKHNDVDELLRDGLITMSDLGSYLVVANVRNPFDRLVTEYKRYTGPWLEEYLSWVRQKLDYDRTHGLLTDREYRKKLRRHRRKEIKTRLWAKILKRTPFGIWILYRMLKWQLQYRMADLKNMAGAGSRQGTNGAVRRDHLEHLFPMLSRVDVVLRQEQLERSLNFLFETMGLDISIALPRINITRGKDIFSTYYPGWTRKMIERVYHSELSRLGYAFNHIEDDCLIVPLSDSFQRKIDTLR